MKRPWKIAPSLRPGQNNIEAACAGNVLAQAVRDIWRFKFPIRIVAPAEYKRMLEAQHGC